MAIDESVDIVNELSCAIDPRYLIKCDWMEMARDDTPGEILRVNNLNAEIFTDCFLRHNQFVKQYSDE